MGEPKLQPELNSNSQITTLLKDFGRTGLAPFVQLLEKYQDELIPYLQSIGEGLRLGAQGLKTPTGEKSDQAHLFVAHLFEDSASWFQKLSQQIGDKNLDQTLDYLQQEGSKHPSLFFSLSYLTGAAIGRLSKYTFKPQGESHGSNE